MTPASAPLAKARLAGLLYLTVIAGGAFAEAFVRMRLVVPGDPAATAANILAHEALFRWAFVADLVPLLCNMVLAVLFYDLFKGVNKGVARLVVLFSLTGSAIQASVLIYHLAALMLVKGGPSLAALSSDQLQALAYFALRLQSQGYTLALVFFGGFGLGLGYLIWKSGFLPRVLGLLMAVAGVCYLTNSLVSFVAPSLSSVLFLLPALMGEGGLTLWLLIAGIDAARWRARAGGSAPPPAVRDAQG